MNKIILYNPAISSLNMGDEIIAESCKKNICSLFSNSMYVEISTHLPINNKYIQRIKNVKYSFVLGSNLLMPKMDARFRQWDIKMWNVDYIKPIILMGVGWNRYSDRVTHYTKVLYKKLLSHEYLNSVRDEYTKIKLNEIGINNVINTGCPTFWDFDKELCREVSKSKSNKVIFTLTDYKRDYKKDKQLIEILKKNYREIYFWTQGFDDYDYFKELDKSNIIKIVGPTLDDFDKILKEKVDYVGTRLHGGIRALKFRCRTIILAVDNRAIELNRNYNIPILKREEIDKLEEIINNDLITDIKIPLKNIERWKNQFKGRKLNE